MQPKSTTSNLPSLYNVKTHIHNQFIKHMKELKEEIVVSKFVLLLFKRYILVTYLSKWLQGRSQ